MLFIETQFHVVRLQGEKSYMLRCCLYEWNEEYLLNITNVLIRVITAHSAKTTMLSLKA